MNDVIGMERDEYRSAEVAAMRSAVSLVVELLVTRLVRSWSLYGGWTMINQTGVELGSASPRRAGGLSMVKYCEVI